MARTDKEIIAAAKSKYIVCPNNAVLQEALDLTRFTVVGLPCHVHGVRKMQRNHKFAKLAGKISFSRSMELCTRGWKENISTGQCLTIITIFRMSEMDC